MYSGSRSSTIDYRSAVAAAEAATDEEEAAAAGEQVGIVSARMDATDGWAIEEELHYVAIALLCFERVACNHQWFEV